MFLFYFSITLAIASSAFYHFVAKSTPAHVNFTVSLLVTYAVALLVTLPGFFFFPATNGITTELKRLSWASIGLAIAIVGIEFGFLLTYRSGWNVGIAAVLVNVVASLILVPVAIFIFKGSLGIPVVDTRIWGESVRRKGHALTPNPASFHGKAWRTSSKIRSHG